MATSDMVQVALGRKGYRDIDTELQGEILTILAFNGTDVVEYEGEKQGAAKWLTDLPSMVMSVDEWDAQYGDITDDDVQAALEVVELPELPQDLNEVVAEIANASPTQETVEVEEEVLVAEKGMTSKEVLFKAHRDRVPVTVEYTDKKGNMSMRTVRVVAIHDTRFSVYDHYSQQFRGGWFTAMVSFAALRPDLNTEESRREAALACGILRRPPGASEAQILWPNCDSVQKYARPHWGLRQSIIDSMCRNNKWRTSYLPQ